MRTYTSAIIADAVANSTWLRWDADLAGLSQICLDRDLVVALSDRGADPGVVQSLLTGLVGGQGIALAQVLGAAGHLELVPGLHDQFVRRSSIEGPIDRVEVTAAAALSDHQLTDLTDQLTRAGRQVVMRVRVDPELIGGVVVRMGDWRHDLSIRSRLNALQRSIN